MATSRATGSNDFPTAAPRVAHGRRRTERSCPVRHDHAPRRGPTGRQPERQQRERRRRRWGRTGDLHPLPEPPSTAKAGRCRRRRSRVGTPSPLTLPQSFSLPRRVLVSEATDCRANTHTHERKRHRDGRELYDCLPCDHGGTVPRNRQPRSPVRVLKRDRDQRPRVQDPPHRASDRAVPGDHEPRRRRQQR